MMIIVIAGRARRSDLDAAEDNRIDKTDPCSRGRVSTVQSVWIRFMIKRSVVRLRYNITAVVSMVGT